MGQPVNIPYHLAAEPLTKDHVSVYKVPAGKLFRVKRLRIRFPSGAGYVLHLWLSAGIRKVTPVVRDYTGDNQTIEATVDLEYHSGTEVVLWYNNESGTKELHCTILLTGNLE